MYKDFIKKIEKRSDAGCWMLDVGCWILDGECGVEASKNSSYCYLTIIEKST